jgi:metal-responsive CopG/Arc/MetJ family transcriptional regulator
LTRISLKLPDWLLRAIDKGADNRATDRSNYIRQAVIDRLHADGIPTRKEVTRADPAKRNV